MKKIFAQILAVTMIFALIGCDGASTTNTNNNNAQTNAPAEDVIDNTCAHSWSAATCTELSKCTLCGETKGAANGHSYTAATCTVAAKCTVCGATNGSAAGHQWSAATCTDAQKCTVCGAAGSAALGHSDNGSGTCSKCGQDIILTALKDGFKAYLIIPSIGSSENHYVQVKFVNRTDYDVKLNMNIYANGKGCANKQLADDYYLKSGYEIVIRFDRNMFKTVKDMYLDNQSTAWTGVNINGEVYNLKFDVNGNTIWGRHPNDIGEY
ncbi:MAG: hypothetical protein IJY79_07235 [Clostridia bacterium]|nr:hypothetical protein [Clostridia bacterium]